MANINLVLLDATPDTLPIPTGLEANIFGSTAGKTINLESGAAVEGLSAGTAAVNLPVSSGAVAFVRAGTTIRIEDNSGNLIAEIAAGTGETTALAFTDFTVEMSVDETDPANPLIVVGQASLADGDSVRGSVPPVPVFELTTGVDTFAPDAADPAFRTTDDPNTFTADLLTLNNGDSIDAGGGTDTLNATVNNDVTDQVSLTSVENLFFTTLGGVSVDAKNFSGVEQFWTKDSSGTLTIDNLGDASTALGFAGSNSTNAIEANYATGALDGSTDTLTVVLDNAREVEATVQAGFEAAALDVTGDSSLETLTIPGVDSLSVTGSGQLTLNSDLTSLSTFNASKMTGAVVGETITGGYATQGITGATGGATVLLGTGDDNIRFTDNTEAGAENTLQLGDGADRLDVALNGAGDTSVLGGNGNDTVRISAGTLGANDLINLGAGESDTLVVGTTTANTMLLRGVENLTLTNTATGANTIEDADQPLNVTAQVGTGGTSETDVEITALPSESTVTVNDAAGQTGGVGDLTVGFKTLEDSTTLDINAQATGGDLTVDNVTDLTLDFAKAANFGAAGKGTDLSDDTKTLSVDGAANVNLGDLSGESKLETLTMTAGGNLTVKDINGTGTVPGLSAVDLTASNGNIAVDTIAASNTAGLGVEFSAKGTIDDGSSAAINVQNTGAITAGIAGAAEATINFTSNAGTAGVDHVVDLSATNTGGLDTTITNNASNEGASSDITLGNAVSTKKNEVEMAGQVDILNITGGTGNDVITFAGDAAINSGTLALGSGTADKVDFSNVAGDTDTLGDAGNGVIVNLSNSTKTFDSGETYQSSIGALKVAEYDDGASTESVLTDDFQMSITGVEQVVGTDQADYLIAANTGSTLTGGAGADTLIGGADNDILTGGAGDDQFVINLTGDTGNTFATADTITDFTTTEDTIKTGVAGNGTNFTEIDGSGITTEAAALTAVDTALAGTVQYAVVYDYNGSGNGYLYYDADGDVSSGLSVIALTGVDATGEVVVADIVA